MTIDILSHSMHLELGPAGGQSPSPWQHWRLARDERGVAWLLLDKRGARVNTLDEDVLEELDAILGTLEQDLPQALVIRSAKPSGFCAGADVGMFRGVGDPLPVIERLRRAHGIMDRLERLSVITVAVIHGSCLGGGLELALACDRRIAIDGATLGFPEVLLGLHPGLGGTYRATELIDPVQAMTLMLTGKSAPAAKAKALGLVDTVIPERHLAGAVATAAAGRLARASRPWHRRLFAFSWLRQLAARRMVAETARKVNRQFYPAPFALINLWRNHGGHRKGMRVGEIKSFARLVTSVAGQNLIRVFFLRETLKGLASQDSTSQQGLTSQGQADQVAAISGQVIRHIHVVGAGTMGGDIAAWCAFSGFRVTLADRDPSVVAAAIARAATLCERKRLDRSARRAVLDRLIPDLAGDGARRADILIEAVPEDTAIKASVYRELEARMKPGAILATNTSSIPLETLRAGLDRPERFLGLHFFNPVAQMQLVELVSHNGVDGACRDRALAFIKAIDRLPAPVHSAPGFLVNRVLTPYLLEAMLLLDEGLTAETIDQAALDFGMPMGPVELADQVGLDICIAVGDMLAERLGGDIPAVPGWIRDKVAAGETGRKAGKGFYSWRDGAPVKHRQKASAEGEARRDTDLADRLILPLLNTCVACLREGIVADANVLDAAVIFGTGFAPFRGGPLHYAHQRGVGDIVASLELLATSHGGRFTPDDGWRDLS